MKNSDIKTSLKNAVSEFRLPRYAELPNVGLYLEQVAKYINGYITPLGCAEITTSMISNYVKKGYIPSPHKKQYDRDRIAYLIFIAITKSVLSMDHIVKIFDMQKENYSIPIAYDYFCDELENMLCVLAELKAPTDEPLGITPNTEVKTFVRNIIISASHSMYLTYIFNELKKQ